MLLLLSSLLLLARFASSQTYSPLAGPPWKASVESIATDLVKELDDDITAVDAAPNNAAVVTIIKNRRPHIITFTLFMGIMGSGAMKEAPVNKRKYFKRFYTLYKLRETFLMRTPINYHTKTNALLNLKKMLVEAVALQNIS